jgi:hypothetical protein
MPTHELAFLVAHARNLEPPFVVSGQQLTPISVNTQDATAQFKEELGPGGAAALGDNGEAIAVVVSVEAPDDDQAIAAAYRQAKRVIEPFSLLEPQMEGINLARFRPDVLPNALMVDKQADPPTAYFRYYDPSRLTRMNLGPDATSVTRDFNNDVVRRIGMLYPSTLVSTSEAPSPLDLRVARAVHWYSQAEGLSDETLVFVCYWIGLEALVLKSSNTTQKMTKIARRLDDLGLHHGDDIDWIDAAGRLWNKRADIVHEGFGVVHEALLPDVSAEDVSAARYLFVVTLLYVLEQRAKGVALGSLWDPRHLDSYVPGVVFTYDRMPPLYHFLNQQRTKSSL